ncbi:hypothetical protein MKW98_007080 [Papaver atlanticum]|uniref:RING-type E3 ubiquitin transferase n=1 Tax=Papaver atlanticum TaxID=357466 RepID=A0AAD4XLW6_9MAGN|nr:hypothetical protein MKW98_007080 [Papaver atlanticum]
MAFVIRHQRSGGRMYYCYQCERTISIPASASDLVCPNCNGEFIEEVENPNPSPSPFLSFSETTHPLGGGGAGGGFPNPFAGIPLFSSASTTSSMEFQNPMNLFTMIEQAMDTRNPTQNQNRSSSQSGGSNDPDVFNPLMFFQNYINSMAGGGADIQFVIENNPMDGELGGGGGGGGFRLPSNLGDYFLGPGLEQLIQQLAENDPNRYGTPPAAKTAIEKLPTVNITEEILSSDSSQCAVCKDEFELGSVTKQMPCKHIYHPDCILPWLELHNSCPVCRYELPTDDPDYEQRSQETTENPSRGGGTGSGDAVPNTPRTTERREVGMFNPVLKNWIEDFRRSSIYGTHRRSQVLCQLFYAW